MQIHEITLAKKNNTTSYAWGGYGFDLRSDVIWPDLAYRKTQIVESQNFDSWLANYAKTVARPQPGDECILALLTHQANPMGPVRGFYGPAMYVDETDQHYVLQISTGEHKYWKNNQIVFANKQDFEKFKVMLALKFGENFKGLEQTEVQESRDARTPTHVSEGLLDTVKSGIKSAATSAAQTIAPMVYGDNGVKPNWMTAASNKAALPQAEKLRQELNKQYGINIQGSKPKNVPTAPGTAIPPVVSYKFTPPATPGVASQTSVLTPNNTSQLLPKPGHVLRVINPANKGIYFKDSNGTWYAPSQARGQPPQKITLKKSIDYLEQQAEGGNAKEVKSQTVKSI